MSQPRILIADDQADVLAALRLLLKSDGYACVSVESPAAALEALAKQPFDAALIDLNYSRDTTSGEEGMALLAALRAADADLPVVLMTAWGTIDIAVRGMRAGAADFIEKPWDNRRLLNVLAAQVKLSQARRREVRLESENALLRGGDEPFIADAESMQPVLEMLRRVAPTDANVLILGENGTGKGVVARRLHALSARAAQPLIKVNMGGINEHVFESEMFGHVKGAFTDAKADRIGRFELADGGSLFLDEIANIPPSQQPKLLRVLEDGELERVGSSRTLKVDVRLISATNADLRAEVASGQFRKDLLFRLNTVEIRLPALRERRSDILPMAADFLQRCARRYGRDGLRLSPSAQRSGSPFEPKTMTTFTPISAVAGGTLIGLAAVLLMFTTGRIAGVSGFVSRLLPPYGDRQMPVRLAFVFGLLSAALPPYPRKPGAEFDWVDPKAADPSQASPFAELAKLKPRD